MLCIKDETLRACLDPKKLNENVKCFPHKIPTVEMNPQFLGAQYSSINLIKKVGAAQNKASLKKCVDMQTFCKGACNILYPLAKYCTPCKTMHPLEKPIP